LLFNLLRGLNKFLDLSEKTLGMQNQMIRFCVIKYRKLKNLLLCTQVRREGGSSHKTPHVQNLTLYYDLILLMNPYSGSVRLESSPDLQLEWSFFTESQARMPFRKTEKSKAQTSV